MQYLKYQLNLSNFKANSNHCQFCVFGEKAEIYCRQSWLANNSIRSMENSNYSRQRLPPHQRIIEGMQKTTI